MAIKLSRNAHRRGKHTRRKRQLGGKTVKHSKLFSNAYAITLLDKFPRRFEKIQEHATKAGLHLQAWNGVIVTPQQINTLPPQGVGTTNFKNRVGDIFNLGVIGAFLAHRGLFRHIVAKHPRQSGTLIFEDDVHITEDFFEKLHAIESEIKNHASNWDILFLDKQLNTISGQPVSKHLIKLDKDMTGFKNWGIWAYIVKNSSLKNRILPHMEHMLDVPDIQLAKFADTINMYLITPSITHGDAETSINSVVSKLNVQQKTAK